jgi:hypothetical protein
LHAITDVANPVIVVAACLAQRGETAVMITRAPRMPNASANVSSTGTPWMDAGRSAITASARKACAVHAP